MVAALLRAKTSSDSLYNTCQHRDTLLVSSEKGNSFRTQTDEAPDYPSSVVYIYQACTRLKILITTVQDPVQSGWSSS